MLRNTGKLRLSNQEMRVLLAQHGGCYQNGAIEVEDADVVGAIMGRDILVKQDNKTGVLTILR